LADSIALLMVCSSVGLAGSGIVLVCSTEAESAGPTHPGHNLQVVRLEYLVLPSDSARVSIHRYKATVNLFGNRVYCTCASFFEIYIRA
jgi:hypothetical protein